MTLAAVIVRLNERAYSWAMATGTIISALTRSRPTTRIAMVTVRAAIVAMSIDRNRTGSPLARANSSSWLTANRAVRRPRPTPSTRAASATVHHRSVVETVEIEPNR